MTDAKKIDRVEMLSGNDLVKESFKDIEDAYCNKKSVYSIPSFSRRLNALLVGLHKSDVIVIAGSPGVGKSAFVHNIICYVAAQQIPRLLFSPEMRKEMVTLRLLSMQSYIACNSLENGEISVADWPEITTVAGHLSDAVLNIDDTLPLPVAKILKIARELKADNILGLLVIDSLPLISMDVHESQDAVGAIMMELKSLARELNIPVLLTVPLKTEPTGSPERYPCLNDIDNDLIVNYADVIIMLHKVMSPNKEKSKVEALVVKNRNGAMGVVPFHLVYKFLRFEELTQQKEQTALEMH